MVTRKDISRIFDSGSFMETGEGLRCSVITGYGTVEGRPVYAFIQDGETDGGAFGKTAGGKICNLYKLASKTKSPVIGVLDSAGFYIDEGAEALEAFSEVYACAASLGDDLLQIMIIGGKCHGQMKSLAHLADFCFRDEDIAESFSKARELVRVMPPSRGILPEQFETSDDLNRLIPGASGMAASGKDLLKALSDDGFFVEIDSDVAPELTAGLIKINGIMVAAMANNTVDGSSRVGYEALIKASRMVRTADKFRLGLVKISNTEGFRDEDKVLMAEASAGLVRALAKADIPKIDLITGSVTGGIYSVFNGRGTASDMIFMWKDAKVNIINPRQAADILNGPVEAADVNEKASEYEAAHSTAEVLEGLGLCDKVIEPEESRKYLSGALESFANIF